MATLLQADNIIKRYGFQEILSGAAFSIAERQKVGVIGRNGAGKSTLLRILIGEEQADEGVVTRHANLRLGYLKQHEVIDFKESAIGYLVRVSGKPDWGCAKVAARFALTPKMLKRAIGELSSGFRMRVRLAAMLALEPNLILLDEPTNFLDLSTQLLLEEFLSDFKGAFLVVSHDREFLKNTCEQTLEIERGRARLYDGNIEQYLAWKEEQEQVILNENRKVDAERKHLQAFVDRFRFKASKASQAQSKIKMIAKLHKIEIEHPMKAARIRIPVDKIKKGIAVSTDELGVGYPGNTVLEHLTFDIERTKHVAVLADNGAGKTTLLRTLAGQLEKLQGEYKWGTDLKLCYYGQSTLESMSPRDSVHAYLSRHAGDGVLNEEVLRMAGNFLFKDDDLEKTVGVLSGGEKARLCMAGMLLSKATVFLLDEPTNHLDFETVEALGAALRDYPGTIVFVSHNRTFVNLVATMILEIKDGGVRRYSGTYEEYVAYLTMRLDAEIPARRVIEEKTSEDASEEELEEKNIREQTEVERKKLRANEKQRVKLEEERDRILAEMAMSPTQYSKNLNVRLHEIGAEILRLEDEWLEIQRNIEWLSRE
ncbi:MAG: ABC-F family ATP-binding cassette domain-containing protein [bacterium]